MIEIVAVEYFAKDGPLIVASCYKPPTNNPIDRNAGLGFFAQFEGLPLNGEDLNAQNTEWGTRKFVETGWRLPRAVVYMTESYSMMNQPHTTVQL
jgi:hypothetical protein